MSPRSSLQTQSQKNPSNSNAYNSPKHLVTRSFKSRPTSSRTRKIITKRHQKIHKTQYNKREHKLNQNRKRECLVFITHGWYENTPYNSFEVPKNIKIIKYSPPGHILSIYAADYITQRLRKDGCNFTSPTKLYYLWDDGFIARELIKQYDCTQCQNMKLNFADDIPPTYYELQHMGTYKFNEITKQFTILDNHSTNKELTLKQYIEHWNTKYPTTELAFHQLTCHDSNVSNFIPSHSDLKRLKPENIDAIINNLGQLFNTVLNTTNSPSDIDNSPMYSDIMKNDKTNPCLFKRPILVSDDKNEIIKKQSEIISNNAIGYKTMSISI